MPTDASLLRDAYLACTEGRDTPTASEELFGEWPRTFAGERVLLLPVYRQATDAKVRRGTRVLGAVVRVDAAVAPFWLKVSGRGNIGLSASIETGDATFDETFSITGNSPELARRVLDAATRAELLAICAGPRTGHWLEARAGMVMHEFPLAREGLLFTDLDVTPDELRRRIAWTLDLGRRIGAECARLALEPGRLPVGRTRGFGITSSTAWLIVVACLAALAFITALAGATLYLFHAHTG